VTHVDSVANGNSLPLIIRWYPLEESLGVDFNPLPCRAKILTNVDFGQEFSKFAYPGFALIETVPPIRIRLILLVMAYLSTISIESR
jgi:hypothetical protein